MTDEAFDSGWLDELADTHEIDRLDTEAIDAILDLAGEVAHSTGDRRNAPLACFLAGMHIGAADLPVNPDTVNEIGSCSG